LWRKEGAQQYVAVRCGGSPLTADMATWSRTVMAPVRPGAMTVAEAGH